MARLSKKQARELIQSHDIPITKDYYRLTVAEVERVLEAADLRRYRKPANYPASRSRAFFYFLQRKATQ